MTACGHPTKRRQTVQSVVRHSTVQRPSKSHRGGEKRGGVLGDGRGRPPRSGRLRRRCRCPIWPRTRMSRTPGMAVATTSSIPELARRLATTAQTVVVEMVDRTDAPQPGARRRLGGGTIGLSRPVTPRRSCSCCAGRHRCGSRCAARRAPPWTGRRAPRLFRCSPPHH